MSEYTLPVLPRPGGRIFEPEAQENGIELA
jgi:hypothetical protein